MTVSSVYPRLYQSKPKPGSRLFHGKSWKNLEGYNRNMRWLRRRHAINRERISYSLACTINILQDLTVKEIRLAWAKIARKLRKANVVAWWIREISRRSNRVHVHLITASDHDPDTLKALIRAACPLLRFRLYFQPVRNAREWSNYLCKSTQFGSERSFHANKVVLFEGWVSLEKHGEINGFWQKKQKKRTPQQNQQRRDYAHKLQEAANDYLVVDAAEYLSDATGLPEHEIVDRYARELITDPTTYQSIADDANKLRGVTPYKVGPFRFTPAPPQRKPPVRKKKGAEIKPPFPPFDPDKCDSITFSGEITPRPPEPDAVTDWQIDL